MVGISRSVVRDVLPDTGTSRERAGVLDCGGAPPLLSATAQPATPTGFVRLTWVAFMAA